MDGSSATAMPRIRQMARVLAETFHPLKIILFGSHARGTAGRGSDVDLLVVTEAAGSKRSLAAQMDLALAKRDLPLDLIVVTPGEFETYRRVAGHIVSPAAREGLVLYERPA